jgi:DNA/RNA-binding domain of Phe-tRNA-synthetase-like protein
MSKTCHSLYITSLKAPQLTQYLDDSSFLLVASKYSTGVIRHMLRNLQPSLHHCASFRKSLSTMSTLANPQQYLDDARIAPEVFQLRPDYRALLLVITNIPPAPSDAQSEALLQEAEASAKATLAKTPVTEIPHVKAWREAYTAFGAKPKKTQNSLEALTRRVDKGLPRVNRLTNIYNAISVKHQIPLGGEDLDKYSGAPFLTRAKGDEKFEMNSRGEVVNEPPSTGEVIWCDDVGVTCRVWNWRQGPRTALTDDTTNVLIIMDALQPFSDNQLNAAAEELSQVLSGLSPEVKVFRRLLKA